MTKILILGSSGQIGSPLCKYLRSKKFTVIEWDKELSATHKLDDPHNIEYLEAAVRKSDIVIFLAFEVGGSKFLLNHDKEFNYIQENVLLMANTFQVLKTYKKPFLFASSQMANMHHTNYGFLKDLGERYTRSIGGWICRFWNVFGEEDPTSEKVHVITDFIRMAKTTGKILMMTEGQEERQFLYIDDCCAGILAWIKSYDLINKNEYFDITSFKWTSILQVANLITSATGTNTIILGNSADLVQRGIKNEPSTYSLNFWTPRLNSLEIGIKELCK